MLVLPGTCMTWFSITSVRPKRCCSEAISVARCGSLPPKVARSWAVPNSPLGRPWELVATAAPTKVAATATVIRASTSSCWRHSRRNSRQAQRITARRAGTPPSRVPAPVGSEPAGRSRSAVLMASAPG